RRGGRDAAGQGEAPSRGSGVAEPGRSADHDRRGWRGRPIARPIPGRRSRISAAELWAAPPSRRPRRDRLHAGYGPRRDGGGVGFGDCWKHHDAVLVAFAATDDDLVCPEVEILTP